MDETQSSARWVSHARGADESLRLFLEAEGGRLVAAGGITFGRATDDYIASLEARIRAGSFRPSTLRTYSNIIEADLRPRWGDRPVGTISREDVEAYRAELVKRSLAASTINQTRAIVRGIFAVAKLDADPSVAFTRANTRRATSGAISFYTPAETQQLAANAADEQDAALYLTAAFTGLRASELRALRWRSIDFTDSLVHVGKGYTDEGGEDLPKSYRARSVPLMPQVARVLTQITELDKPLKARDPIFAGVVSGCFRHLSFRRVRL